MAQTPSKIFIIGGTGAQGIPVITALTSDSKYSCLVLTRDTTSPRAKHLSSLPNVTLLSGTFTSEPLLRSAFSSCDGAFINIDGFNTGEKTEMYWAIRCYELALECGIKFFVYGNLDYVYKKSLYDPRFRTGHYDGKGRIGEWILQQTKENGSKMGAALFTTGPYIEMAISSRTVMTPVFDQDGMLEWRVPLGEGAVVHVALEDCGYYVRWLFDNVERANGMDLEVAIAHITYKDLAQAFTKVTGHKARFMDVSLEEYWEESAMKGIRDEGAGYNADAKDPATMSVRDNFTGFWRMWGASGPDGQGWKGEGPLIKRDYKLLDEIHPNRIKSAEQWFRHEDARGRALGLGGLWDRVQNQNIKPILKIGEDGRKGRL